MNVEFGNYRFPDQGSAPISIAGDLSATPPESSVTLPGLRELDEQQLFTHISTALGAREIKIYGDTDEEEKLIFQGAYPERNIQDATTVRGKPIYNEKQNGPRHSEMDELASRAYEIMQGSKDYLAFVSEAADVFYNFVRLIDLSSSEARADEYWIYMNRLADAIGWSPREALLLAATKYHRRFVVKREKDVNGENRLIEELLKEPGELSGRKNPFVKTPNYQQVKSTYYVAEDIILHHLPDMYKLAMHGKVKPREKRKLSKEWKAVSG